MELTRSSETSSANLIHTPRKIPRTKKCYSSQRILGGKTNNFIPLMSTITFKHKYANGVLSDVARRIYQGLLYFKLVIGCRYTRQCSLTYAYEESTTFRFT